MWRICIRFIHQVIHYTRGVTDHFIDNRCLRVASALSFTTLLALVPLMTVVFSMLSIFPVFESWVSEIESFLYRNFMPSANAVVQQNLHQFATQAGKLTAVGLFFLVLSALFLLATIEDAFNDIWRLKRGRTIIQRVAIYWTVITLGPLLIGISLSLSSYLVSMSDSVGIMTFGRFNIIMLSLLPFIFECMAFVGLYMTVPNCRVRFCDALPGGIVAALLFEIAKSGFTYFVISFGTYQVIYGALATIPLFLIWLYLSWIVVLVGAEIAAVLPEFRQNKQPLLESKN